jgi:uncharacterized protein (TIGR00369 family)
MTTSTHYGVSAPEEIARRTGLEFLRAIVNNELPQAAMAGTLAFRMTEVGDGYAIFEAKPGPELFNPLGTVHGGWALALIDSATGCAGHTLLPAGVGYTTIETKANFSRPIFPETGTVRAEGRVITRGRTIITAEARVTDAQGRVLAHGTSTMMVLQPR